MTECAISTPGTISSCSADSDMKQGHYPPMVWLGLDLGDAEPEGRNMLQTEPRSRPSELSMLVNMRPGSRFHTPPDNVLEQELEQEQVF